MAAIDTNADAECSAQALRLRLQRSATLAHLLATYATDEGIDPQNAPHFEAWLARSGELPPDFDALPTNAGLPPLLVRADGSPVASAEEWPARRAEMLRMLVHYQLGQPPPAPGAMFVEDVDEQPLAGGGAVLRKVLVYGPDAKAVAADRALAAVDAAMYRTVRLRVEITLPDGGGPHPALVTLGRRDGDHLRGWLGEQAVAAGYVVCAFDRDDAFRAHDVYACQEWTELGWWAYAASRCVDYLAGLEAVDAAQVAIAGHSRGAKMALIAAALDERFAAAVISHPGSGTGMTEPWRYIGEKYGGETLEYSTRVFPYWNHPRLRFFAGRENKLPFDAHFMVALVAPRALLMTEGDADDVGEPWGAQQSYLAASEVWALLGQPERLGIAFHAGGHRLAAAVLQGYVDWIDMQFGRRPFAFANTLMYPYTFEAWRAATGQQVDPLAYPDRLGQSPLARDDGSAVDSAAAWPQQRAALQRRILDMVSELPPLGAGELTIVRQVERDGLVAAEAVLPDGLPVHLTYRADAEGPLPVAVYLHGHLDTCGWAWSAEYGWTPAVGERLAQQGLLAVEYDQYGYGRRNRVDVLEMFAAHPEWSVLGVMVQDARRVANAAAALPMAAAGQVAVVGYSLGGLVAMLAAALDERIAAAASTCGIGSLRRDAHGAATEGLRRYAHLRPLLPRLGFFVGHEARAPFDMDDVLALIAPRPVLVLAPTLDQDWLHADVRACYEGARPVYALLGAPEALAFMAPDDFNRYPPKYQELVNRWLLGALHSAGAAG